MARSELVMYVPATVRCDVCETPHTETNGWFSIYVGVGIITIRAFEDANKNMPAVCGERCLHTYISQNLGKINERKLSAQEA